jgi:hypothetical protein
MLHPLEEANELEDALLAEIELETPSKHGMEYLLETNLVLHESTAVRG